MTHPALDSGAVTIGAADEWAYAYMPAGPFGVLFDGNLVGTKQLQFSLDDGATWAVAVADLDDLGVAYGTELSPGRSLWRLGVPAGGYSSGTGTARLFRSRGGD